MKTISPKLIAFDNSLDDKQKAAFDEMREHWGRHRRHHRHGEE
ncbi:hypothetical protein [Rhodoblastus sp.]